MALSNFSPVELSENLIGKIQNKQQSNYVRGIQLNKVIQNLIANINTELLKFIPSEGTLRSSTLEESTSNAGITIDGALIKDGSFTGKYSTVTAVDPSETIVPLTGSDQFITVTSSDAGFVVALPENDDCPIGTVIRGWVGANGFELRGGGSDITVNNVSMDGNEAAIPATTFFTVTKVTATGWILTAIDEVGAVVTAIIPDAV